MPLKAGSIHDEIGSMALEMAEAFLQEWPYAMADQPRPEMNNQMRLLFVAIAKGVVNHLSKNPDAFTVTVADELVDLTGSVTTIETI